MLLTSHLITILTHLFTNSVSDPDDVDTRTPFIGSVTLAHLITADPATSVTPILVNTMVIHVPITVVYIIANLRSTVCDFTKLRMDVLNATPCLITAIPLSQTTLREGVRPDTRAEM